MKTKKEEVSKEIKNLVKKVLIKQKALLSKIKEYEE